MRKLKIWLSLFVCSLIVGCCANGCFVPYGPGVWAVSHPPPLDSQWSKPEMTQHQRLQDWVVCGGYKDGNIRGVVAPENATSEVRNEMNRNSYQNIQRCMLKKGYRWSGRCDNEVMKSEPMCGAP